MNEQNMLLTCPTCYGQGYISVCGWCEQGVEHSHCDDTWKKPCGCKLYEHKYRFHNAGLWLQKQDGLWLVCRDYVNYSLTTIHEKNYKREDCVKALEAKLESYRNFMKMDLQDWAEEDIMKFMEWSRGERKSI